MNTPEIHGCTLPSALTVQPPEEIVVTRNVTLSFNDVEWGKTVPSWLTMTMDGKRPALRRASRTVEPGDTSAVCSCSPSENRTSMAHP